MNDTSNRGAVYVPFRWEKIPGNLFLTQEKPATVAVAVEHAVMLVVTLEEKKNSRPALIPTSQRRYRGFPLVRRPAVVS